MSLKKHVITINCKIIDALKIIDENKRSFLVVEDAHSKVVGILTEGDIRRSLINGISINNKIVYNRDFISINKSESFLKLFKYFKLEKINFLPILNDNMQLINIISKKQFHLMLLNDIEYDLNKLPYLDENELDNEVSNRPWGFYKSTLLAEHVQSKIITVFPREELSLQKHKRREEHWIVIRGEGQIILEDSVIVAEQGRYVYIPKGCKHKVINTSSQKNLIFAEVQLGDYFGEDDIIRYEDKYGRV